jgi:transcriptional regulator with XRE-family HTH domain
VNSCFFIHSPSLFMDNKVSNLEINVKEKVSFLGALKFPCHSGNSGMANRIKEIRTAQGKSQEWLGEQIGVKKALISKLERGHARLTDTYLAGISVALKCDPWELTGRGSSKRLPPEKIAARKASEDDRTLDGLIEYYQSLSPEKQRMFDALREKGAIFSKKNQQ